LKAAKEQAATRDAPSADYAKPIEVARLKHIANLVGSIFVHGDFKAETYNERELEKLLREQGCFYESVAEYDKATAGKETKGDGND
jgi:hypothetical protein